MSLAKPAIEAAAARLRGQIVTTPLIGGPWLPDFPAADVAVKLEVLQPAGSVWFRGALHALLRDLGARRGLAIAARARPALAWATAGSMLRLAVEAFVHGPLDAAIASSFVRAGARVEHCVDAAAAQARASQLAVAQGYRQSSGLDDPDVALGIATLGLELARDLAAECEVVHVSPAELAVPVAAGLRAGGRELPVRGAGLPEVRELEALRAAVRAGLRVEADANGLAALAAALADRTCRSACAVLAE